MGRDELGDVRVEVDPRLPAERPRLRRIGATADALATLLGYQFVPHTEHLGHVEDLPLDAGTEEVPVTEAALGADHDPVDDVVDVREVPSLRTGRHHGQRLAALVLVLEDSDHGRVPAGPDLPRPVHV